LRGIRRVKGVSFGKEREWLKCKYGGVERVKVC
jgi:hypothetical protein